MIHTLSTKTQPVLNFLYGKVLLAIKCHNCFLSYFVLREIISHVYHILYIDVCHVFAKL